MKLYPDRTREYEVMARARCEQTIRQSCGRTDRQGDSYIPPNFVCRGYNYEWFPGSICNGCGMPAGNSYPSGHLVPSPFLGLACAPIVETRFLELAMSLLDFSP